MSRMLAPFWQWLDGRTIRERRMLVGMVVLLGLTAAWLLVVRPAWAWQADAADRQVQARSDLQTVRTAAARHGAGARPGAIPGAPDVTDIGAVAQASATSVGLTIETSMDAAGGLAFRASKVSTAALFAWLQDMKTRHGVEATTLSVVENADATLEVEGGLTAGR